MKLCALMAVYDDEPLVGRAIDSLVSAGLPAADVLCFDGAWRGFGAGASTDATQQVVEQAGATWFPHEVWPSQEAKRSQMFYLAFIAGYTHGLVVDSDEVLGGTLPPKYTPVGHANVLLRSVGPNDMPGIRGEWPNGDYYQGLKPQLRWFRLSRSLHCKWPGGYFDDDGAIRPYADSKGTSALPVVKRVSIDHHPNDRPKERINLKRKYLKDEHPKRIKRQIEHNRALRLGTPAKEET